MNYKRYRRQIDVAHWILLNRIFLEDNFMKKANVVTISLKPHPNSAPTQPNVEDHNKNDRTKQDDGILQDVYDVLKILKKPLLSDLTDQSQFITAAETPLPAVQEGYLINKKYRNSLLAVLKQFVNFVLSQRCIQHRPLLQQKIQLNRDLQLTANKEPNLLARKLNTNRKQNHKQKQDQHEIKIEHIFQRGRQSKTQMDKLINRISFLERQLSVYKAKLEYTQTLASQLQSKEEFSKRKHLKQIQKIKRSKVLFDINELNCSGGLNEEQELCFQENLSKIASSNYFSINGKTFYKLNDITSNEQSQAIRTNTSTPNLKKGARRFQKTSPTLLNSSNFTFDKRKSQIFEEKTKLFTRTGTISPHKATVTPITLQPYNIKIEQLQNQLKVLLKQKEAVVDQLHENNRQIQNYIDKMEDRIAKKRDQIAFANITSKDKENRESRESHSDTILKRKNKN